MERRLRLIRVHIRGRSNGSVGKPRVCVKLIASLGVLIGDMYLVVVVVVVTFHSTNAMTVLYNWSWFATLNIT